jgi:transcription elongation factor GreB
MGRWRPPRPASSPYITRTGFANLEQELKDLWVRRRDVVKALSAAAAEGDRTENAEYIYRKKELGGIDYRIRYLQKRIPKLNIVEQMPRPDKVFFGAWVLLERDDGSTVEYRIVGPDEIDAADEYISMDSPLAKALLRKQIDDDVQITVTDKREIYLVAGIRYQ